MPSTYTSLACHVIFSTKDREPMIASPWRQRLHEYVGGCIRSAGSVPLQVGGTADHLHVLIASKPTQCVSKLLCDVKSASSGWVHANVTRRFAWQDGYAAFSVSPSACAAVEDYIRRQEEHHRTRTFQEEYRDFLVRAGVAFDERFLF